MAHASNSLADWKRHREIERLEILGWEFTE
jgi:hypothetical protein